MKLLVWNMSLWSKNELLQPRPIDPSGQRHLLPVFLLTQVPSGPQESGSSGQQKSITESLKKLVKAMVKIKHVQNIFDILYSSLIWYEFLNYEEPYFNAIFYELQYQEEIFYK